MVELKVGARVRIRVRVRVRVTVRINLEPSLYTHYLVIFFLVSY